MGSFPTAPAQKKLLLVATDYFSKWIEVDAFVSIKDRDVTRFIWKNIVCQFGIPRSIVSNNWPQFDSRVYWEFFQELKIRNLYSTPRYPQSNGQAKASNKTLVTALKKRLDSAKGTTQNALGLPQPENQSASLLMHSPTGWRLLFLLKSVYLSSGQLRPNQKMQSQWSES